MTMQDSIKNEAGRYERLLWACAFFYIVLLLVSGFFLGLQVAVIVFSVGLAALFVHFSISGYALLLTARVEELRESKSQVK
jgi:hypothetical protein